ncbi:MAG: tRNA (adenosine(37)-N6)-dimethylallyltransferase MiaA [Acidobacteria bacterium]|nr:tRNA (adenosine(37)-N6)-dimethylallyltransferase MiaA [Acidobacteriota bacterium]
MPKPYPAVAIVGPTASGKSGLGIYLAGRFDGEILSCDALQLYRHMDIGTAKVSAALRERVPHHMLDLLDPTEEFSAGSFQSLARKSLAEIRGRAHIPFVVGGTGFYLRALLEGLFDGPSREDALRARMRRIIERRGPEALHRALRRVDPVSAQRIADADGERIIRAYEICLASGRPMSWWQRQPRNALYGYRWLKIGILIPRPELYERINRRVEEMFRSGFPDEVRALLSRYPRSAPAFKAIGYRHVVDYIDGKFSLEEAVENTKMQSRRYAKRQMTWFRKDPEILWIEDADEPENLKAKAKALVEGFLGEIA